MGSLIKVMKVTAVMNEFDRVENVGLIINESTFIRGNGKKFGEIGDKSIVSSVRWDTYNRRYVIANPGCGRYSDAVIRKYRLHNIYRYPKSTLIPSGIDLSEIAHFSFTRNNVPYVGVISSDGSNNDVVLEMAGLVENSKFVDFLQHEREQIQSVLDDLYCNENFILARNVIGDMVLENTMRIRRLGLSH